LPIWVSPREEENILFCFKMEAVPLGNIKGEGDDPRIPSLNVPGYVRPQERLLHDPNVSFEEYHHYALKTRAEENDIDRNDPSRGKVRLIDILFPPKRGPGIECQVPVAPESPPDEEKRRSSVNANLAVQATRAVITDEEWKNASRALRTATWAACFYLITTDILGPFGVGFSLGTLGWGPGIALFTVFGLMAG
jgi:hypothetical protein